MCSQRHEHIINGELGIPHGRHELTLGAVPMLSQNASCYLSKKTLHPGHLRRRKTPKLILPSRKKLQCAVLTARSKNIREGKTALARAS